MLIGALVVPTVVIYMLYALANHYPELSVREACIGGLQCTLPVTLYVLFFAVPSRARVIAPAFDCQEFEYDDLTRETHDFLRADLRVRCEGANYEAILQQASAYLLVWSVGIPCLIALLLFTTKWLVHSKACGPTAWGLLRFLHGDYRPAYYCERQNRAAPPPLWSIAPSLHTLLHPALTAHTSPPIPALT